MRSVVLFIFLCFAGITANAQQNYDASLIPKELLPYASAVIRNQEVSVEVNDLDNTLYHIQKAITVLNKNGDDLAHMVVWHNKNKVIKYIKGAVYNEYGKQIRKFSERDFEDISAVNDFSLFEDERVKHYIPAITVYPYTIVYEYEQRNKQSLNFEDWMPAPFPGLAVEKSSYTFICKADFNIRYKEINLSAKASVAINPMGLKTYSWQVNNIKAARDEPYSPDKTNFLSRVMVAPEKFSYAGISGSFTNWRELGKWNYDKLLKNRNTLPAETIDHIKSLTKDVADSKLKAKRIYEYMQQKTRYVSVQIGIGGYQPFMASDVDRLNYGDCKALVNYMQALLNAVNIDSYYCVVEAGDHKINLLEDFASMAQGNHIILCLPFKNDTTWLECTSQKIPFGFLGDFTDDRIVLACTPEGGKLLHTPKYTSQINLQARKANFIIDEKGELSGEIETIFKGTQYENREEIINESTDEKNKYFQKVYPINNLEIKNAALRQDKSLQPVTNESIHVQARDFASADEDKLYFSLNPVNRITKPLRAVKNRLNPVYINRGFTDVDEVDYTLPKGYKLYKMPLNVFVEKRFGTFSATMTVNGDKLIFKRKLQLIDGTYSKETYEELVDFFEKVIDVDNYNVTLIKTNN